MKKKFFASLIFLFAATTLAACSSNSNKETKASSTADSSKVVESSTEESSTSQSSETITLKESTVTYLSDAEIDAITTIGDFKHAFTSLMESYVADFDELIAQLPDGAKTQLEPYRGQLVEMLEQQKAALDTQMQAAGDDSTEIPVEVKESLASTLKTVRDQLKQAMETARSQAEAFLQ